MSRGPSPSKRTMSIRSYIIWVFTGTVTFGLCIAGYFSWSAQTLQRMQYEVTGQSLALRELRHFGEQLDLLLVSSDLALGSGETYTAQIAVDLSRKQGQLIDSIALNTTLPYDSALLDRIGNLLAALERQIEAQDSVAADHHDRGRNGLLARFDATSGEIVTLFEQVFADAQRHAEQMNERLSVRRSTIPRNHILALILYLVANAAIVVWSFRKIAWPVEELTRSTSTAIADNLPFDPSIRGPREIGRLASSFYQLVQQLEDKVALRTQALREKTESLEREVSERKAVQADLELAKSAAEKSSRIKSEFLSVMSHELRTPMNAVLGSLSLISDSGVNAEQESYIRIAEESGHALMGLLGDVLDISKIESEGITLRNEPFALADLVNTTLDMLRARASEKGLQTSALIYPELPEVLTGDFNRLRQILINLVGNAIKFTERGSVDIDVSLQSRDQDDYVVRFDITDSGVGIAESDQDSIFDRFSQLDSSLAREHAGVGLGLSICSRLVSAMGGECGVDSSERIGSTFWFTIALTGEQRTASGQGTVVTREPCQPVLIVEHDYAYAAGWVAKLLDTYAIPFTIVADFAGAKAELSSAVCKGIPYGCSVVAVQCVNPHSVEVLEQFACLAHLLENSCIVLSDEKLPVASYADKGLVDHVHSFCAAQNNLVARIVEGYSGQTKAEPVPTVPATSAPGVRAQSAGARVLLVEDSEVNQLIAATILRNSGHHVEVASSGNEALQRLEECNCDVILMDLQMPEMDGLEATRLIRGLPGEVSNTPIIAFSANAMEATRDQCSAAGMNDFISKPFVTEQLLAKIAFWVPGCDDVREAASCLGADSHV